MYDVPGGMWVWGGSVRSIVLSSSSRTSHVPISMVWFSVFMRVA